LCQQRKPGDGYRAVLLRDIYNHMVTIDYIDC
jgi:hypothetical protein